MDNANINNQIGNHFIFPGLRELLIGIAALAGLEYLFGESALASLPLQQIFLAILALIIRASTLTMLIIWAEQRSAGIIGFFLISGVFFAGIYGIGILFPPLAIQLPNASAVPNWLNELISWRLLTYTIFAIWKSLVGLGVTYGWFTIIGTVLLMVHIQTKHGKALVKWFNDL